MKGIIFNLLEEFVVSEQGEDTWDDLLEASGLEGAYTAPGNYPDEELLSLVDALAARSHEAAGDILRSFGAGAIPLLAASYATFFAGHHSLRTFLPTINDVIHAEVRKLYPGAETPWFEVDDGADGPLSLTYTSTRRLCTLAEGFITGAAAEFHEVVRIEQPQCMLRGDSQCVLVCTIVETGP